MDETARVLIEASTDPIHKKVVDGLRAIETDYREGKIDRDDVNDRLTELKSALAGARIRRAARLKAKVEDAREAWEKDRPKRATADLAAQGDARSRIAAMDDDEIESLAMAYVNETENLSRFEIRELRARLRSTPDLEHLGLTVRQTAEKRLSEAPWVSDDPDTLEAYNEASAVLQQPPDGILFPVDGDSPPFLARLDEALDLEGELDAAED